MAWITLTSAACQERLLAAEFAALSTVSLPEGKTADDIVGEVVTEIANEIRGRVAACARNTLGEAGTIPDELLLVAKDLFVYRFLNRVPGMARLLNQTRRDANASAEEKLVAVAKCQFAIVPPATAAPAEEQAGGGNMQVVASRTRTATRTGLSGLL